jgi:DNA-binding XRE family transcriptional regulator
MSNRKVGPCSSNAMREHLGSYIRAHRKRTGLSQRELARVLGYDHGGPVSRHERLRSLPPLLIAIGYSVVFRRPVSEIFAGLSETVELAVEERLSELALELKEPATTSSRKLMVARKLEWVSHRRKPGGAS